MEHPSPREPTGAVAAPSSSSTSALVVDPAAVAVFDATGLDHLATFFDINGFAVVRGLWSDDELDAAQADLIELQQRLVAGELPPECGTAILDDPDALVEGEPFAHYVCHATEVSPSAHGLVTHPVLVAVMHRLLGPTAWLLDYERFGVVYQDARPGRASGYSRIGWHSDFQSGPHLAIWPSVAFTIHLDATSPANGFLRAVPGSHHRPADLPDGFEKVPGEIAVYCERGDVLLHHADLWHAAARATEDPPGGVRRHLRGSWYAGERLARGHGLDDFVKNAAR